MKLEKGMMFLLKEGIVGTVRSIKDSKKEQYVISTNNEPFIWYNKTGVWSKDAPIGLNPLTESNLLIFNVDATEFIGEDSDSENTEWSLCDGDVYKTSESDYIVFELNGPVKIFNESYEFIGVTKNGEATSPVVYFTESGISSKPSITITEYKRNIYL